MKRFNVMLIILLVITLGAGLLLENIVTYFFNGKRVAKHIIQSFSLLVFEVCFTKEFLINCKFVYLWFHE